MDGMDQAGLLWMERRINLGYYGRKGEELAGLLKTARKGASIVAMEGRQRSKLGCYEKKGGESWVAMDGKEQAGLL